jgi:hypothetical protein
MAAERSSITAGQVTATAYTMIVTVSIFCLARFAFQFWRKSAAEFRIEDFFVIFSWLSFLALAIDTIIVTPIIYRLLTVVAGENPLYTAIEHDANFQLRVAFPNALLLWTTLWAVKFSLLSLFRRLLKRLPARYIRWWWSLVIFTILVVSPIHRRHG